MSDKCNHCYDKIATHKCPICSKMYFCLECVEHHYHECSLIKTTFRESWKTFKKSLE